MFFKASRNLQRLNQWPIVCLGQLDQERLDGLSSTPGPHWHHVLEEEARLNEKMWKHNTLARKSPLVWQCGGETPSAKQSYNCQFSSSKFKKSHLHTHTHFLSYEFFLLSYGIFQMPAKKQNQTNKNHSNWKPKKLSRDTLPHTSWRQFS